MKIRLSLFFLFVPLSLNLFGDNEAQQINLEHQHQHGNHGEYFDPADKPELYYDRGDQEIILVADGFVSSYDVNIVSLSTLQLVLHSTANGYGDTIDVSSLPNDDYVITLDPPVNVSFEGTFSVYTHQ